MGDIYRNKKGEIVGYTQGQTFSAEDIRKISPKMKKYELVVPEDAESEYGCIHATSPKLAHKIAKDELKAGVGYELFSVATRHRKLAHA